MLMGALTVERLMIENPLFSLQSADSSSVWAIPPVRA
jgi:hypothetical protein